MRVGSYIDTAVSKKRSLFEDLDSAVLNSQNFLCTSEVPTAMHLLILPVYMFYNLVYLHTTSASFAYEDHIDLSTISQAMGMSTSGKISLGDCRIHREQFYTLARLILRIGYIKFFDRYFFRSSQ